MKKLLLGFLTRNAANPIEGLANTALSLIKDKTRDADTSFIRETIRKGVSISSKRFLNLTGTGAIIIVALADMRANGINGWNLGLVAVGVVFSVVMAYITNLNERKIKEQD